jgi:hypothetical protein
MRGHIRSYQLKQGQKKWAIVLFLGKDSIGKRKYRWIRGFQTRREADAEMRRVLRSMDEGTYVQPSKETLGAFLDRWLVTYAKPNVAGKTYERYEQIIEKDIKPSIGSIALAKLTPVHIAEFYSYASPADANEQKADYPNEPSYISIAFCEKLSNRPSFGSSVQRILRMQSSRHGQSKWK